MVIEQARFWDRLRNAGILWAIKCAAERVYVSEEIRLIGIGKVRSIIYLLR